MTEVNISRMDALRTALHIRSKENYQDVFTWIKLEAPKEGQEHGRMLATDGYSLIVAEEAHDSPETVLWRPVGKWKVPKGAQSVRLTSDAMWIQSRSSGDVKRIEWKDASEMTWPDVDRVIPSEDAGVKVLQGPVDAIRGGKIAEAYQSSKRGPNLSWVPMPGGKMARLNGTNPLDLVILVPLRDVEGWVTNDGRE